MEDLDLKRKVTARFSIYLLLLATSLFLPAQTIDWPMAWAYLLAYALIVVIGGAIMLKRKPELARERMEALKKVKGADKLLTALMAIGPFAVLIVAGLDHCYGWSTPASFSAQVIALCTAMAGSFLTFRAMMSNDFFSSVVRIQTERNHKVVTTGPYRFLRHPGYAGMFVHTLSLPVVLSSAWAVVPAGYIVFFLIIRIMLEERLLKADLTGYKEYAARVRFRLIPGMW